MSERNNTEAIQPTATLQIPPALTLTPHRSLPCPSHANHIAVAFLCCHLSHKTTGHPRLECWYNRPERTKSSQNSLLRPKITSVKLKSFANVPNNGVLFAHRNNETSAISSKSITQLRVMKVFKRHLQEFLTIESPEYLPIHRPVLH